MRLMLLLALIIAGSILINACSEQPSQPTTISSASTTTEKASSVPSVIAIDQDFLRDLMTACESVPEWEEVRFDGLVAGDPQTMQPANFDPGETMTVELLQVPGLPVPDSHSIIVETPTNAIPTPDDCIIFRVTGLSDTDQYKVDSWFPEWIEEANLFGSNFAFYKLEYSVVNDPTSDIVAAWLRNVIIDPDGLNGPLVVTMRGEPEKPNRSYWVGDPHAPGDD